LELIEGEIAVDQLLILLAEFAQGLELGHALQQAMSFLGGLLAEAVGLDHLLELVEALAGLGDRLGIGRQDEVARLSAKDEVVAATLGVVLGLLALQLGNLLVEVSRQFIDA